MLPIERIPLLRKARSLDLTILESRRIRNARILLLRERPYKESVLRQTVVHPMWLQVQGLRLPRDLEEIPCAENVDIEHLLKWTL